MKILTVVVASAGLLYAANAMTANDHDHKGHGAGGDLHAVMMSGMESMKSMKMTGDVDKDYAAMMIKHHEDAIAMNKVLAEQGKNAELKAIAQKMTAQQNKEIEQLKKFR